MNIIPAHSGHDTLSYYCTWSAQNAFWPFNARKVTDSDFLGDQGAEHAREYMTEEHIFGEGGLIHQHPATRDQMFFVLDDGWDVAPGVHPKTQRWRFGSLIPDADRFPSFPGTPVERLAALVNKVRSFGWKGLGIWVAAQAVGEDSVRGSQSDAEMEAYWSERLLWSAQADVSYWKVDWGHRCSEIPWRRRLSELRDQYAPGLIIEHCLCMSPVNNLQYDGDTQSTDGRFAGWGDIPQKCAEIASFSDTFRTYDVLHPFSIVSTLDRIAYLLPALNGTPCILNCEDEPYIGAVLGCALGVMRFDPPVRKAPVRKAPVRLAEVTRALRWQKLAPPFASAGDMHNADDAATDTAFFHSGDTWYAAVIDRKSSQSCPEVLTRGLQPIRIEYDDALHPILMFSRNPKGAIAAASLPRNIAEEGRLHPLASAAIPVGAEHDVTVGLFGRWKSVTLVYDCDITGASVWAQDPACSCAEDITSRVTVTDHTVEIPGDLIEAIGTAANGTGDDSDPGMVVRLSL